MKAAVVGCGRMGAEPSSRLQGLIPAGWLPISHAESIQQTQDIELAALCDTDMTRLEKLSPNYPGAEMFSDYQEMIDSIQPDILTIATRTPTKQAIIEYACQKGIKGIYVEKPLANSIQQVNNILSITRKQNVKLFYGVNRRYHPVYRQAKAMIENDEIGDVCSITIEHGLSQLLWAHPHSTDTILYLLGHNNLSQVSGLTTEDSTQRKDNYLVDSDPVVEQAFFKFDTGQTAHIIHANGMNTHVNGSRGKLIIHADGAFIQVSKGNEKQAAYYMQQEWINPLPEQSTMMTALAELRLAILEAQDTTQLEQDILVGTQMLKSIVWSSLNDSRILPVNETPEALVVTGQYKGMYA